MVTLNVYESVGVWGDCVWNFGFLRLFLRLFMDFGVALVSVRVTPDLLWVFGVSPVVFLGV